MALNWTPQIGDPTLGGWITVFAYVVCALVCGIHAFKVRQEKSPGSDKREKWFWIYLTLLMCFLSANKQLDLQSLFTEIGKALAQQQGWYDNRRQVQLLFIAGVIIGSTGFIAIMTIVNWDLMNKLWLAVLGVALLLGFVFIRASSFHHFDDFIGWQVTGLRMNWIMEIGAITLITLSALLNLRNKSISR